LPGRPGRQTVTARVSRRSSGSITDSMPLPRHWGSPASGRWKKLSWSFVRDRISFRYSRCTSVLTPSGDSISCVSAPLHTPPHLVTANDVRALVGVLELDGAAKGFLSTTSDFAPKITSDSLLKKVIPSRIQLINGTALFARLEELAGRRFPTQKL
jgi:hypothetical protein